MFKNVLNRMQLDVLKAIASKSAMMHSSGMTLMKSKVARSGRTTRTPHLPENQILLYISFCQLVRLYVR